MKDILFTVGDWGIGIEDWMPQRRRPVLTLVDGTKHTALAYFRNQETAELFRERLERMIPLVVDHED